MIRVLISLFLLMVGAIALPFSEAKQPPAPLFVDPNGHGSCDPEIVWNEGEQEWWIFYTARRSFREDNFLATPIGVASSKNLADWEFRGYCSFDGVKGKPDNASTFWAPAIVRKGDRYHMFVTWKVDTDASRGIWGGPGAIVHYSAPAADLLDGWTKVSVISPKSQKALDATVRKQEGKWHLWYKSQMESKKAQLIHMVSEDLNTWTVDPSSMGDVFNKKATGYWFEEGPYRFSWKGKHWMITDSHKGLLVYASEDLQNWSLNNVLLEHPGDRVMDGSVGRSCSVTIVEGRAFIFYHVEPWRDYNLRPDKQPASHRRSVLQMAELKLLKGKIYCNRNARLPLPKW